MNRTTITILVTSVALVGLAFYVWLKPDPLEVVTVEVARGDVTATVANTRAGTVDACRRAGLSPAMGGQISSLPVKDGDRVTAGQILVELWNDDQRAELLLAKRDAVASAARADEACVRAKVAKREGARLTELREQGLVSEEQAEAAVGDAQATAAACKASRDAVKVSNARIDVARARLELTILRAPFDGVIAEINGELGEFVTPSPVGIATPPTVDLIDSSCLYISAPIDEVDAPAVRPGQRAFITLDAFPDQRYPGLVRRVAPYVLDLEKQARTVEVEVEIENSGEDSLLPGYSADVEVILDSREDVLRVPSQLIVKKEIDNGIDIKYVLLLEEGVIEERLIEAGISNWQFTEVLSGLKEGDLVILTVDREGVKAGASAVQEE